MWPQKRVSPLYQRLGQFQHLTLKLPAISAGVIITGHHHEELIKMAKALILQAAGDGFIPAYRLVGENQSKSHEFYPIHFHLAVSIHRFRVTDKPLAKSFCPSHCTNHLIKKFYEPLLQVPPLVLEASVLSDLSHRWAQGIYDLTGLEADHPSELVDVSHSKDWSGVQNHEDRRALAVYHACPLKTLMDAVDFRYRPHKYDVEIRYPSTERFQLSVPRFVRRYVVEPIRVGIRARPCGALWPTSTFAPALKFASETGLLDHPVGFFRSLGSGMTWDQAIRAIAEASIPRAKPKPS
ncbi:MAG: hypothetical protein KAV82_07765 [Phycisphaerae bacterium]|nr:hypothetical protein [Phycisphaerae bacterium]